MTATAAEDTGAVRRLLLWVISSGLIPVFRTEPSTIFVFRSEGGACPRASIRRRRSTPNNYLYRGEQYDSDLGLYYLRARYYNPQTGRFMSRDPEDGDITIPATLHKYLFADGNPVDGIDPMGREDLGDVEELDQRDLDAAARARAEESKINFKWNLYKAGLVCLYIGVEDYAHVPRVLGEVEERIEDLACLGVAVVAAFVGP